jgi:predicted PurR-regulated permease PerM
VFVGISAVLTVALLVAVRQVLLPFFLALLLAYVLTPMVALGEDKLRLPRSASIVGVYVIVVGVVWLSLSAMAPRIYEESVRFAREVPTMARNAAHQQGPRLEKWVNAYQDKTNGSTKEKPAKPASAFRIDKQGDDYVVDIGSGVTIVEEGKGRYKVLSGNRPETGQFKVSELVDQGMERAIDFVRINAVQFIKVGQTILATFSRAVFLLFMIFMVAGYVMHTRENIFEFFRSLVPRIHRPGFNFLLARVDRGLAGVVRGQLIICVVNGILSAIGFWIFGLKYWPVFSLLAGVMSIIPIFGSILSTIPAVLIGLTQDVWTALWVLLWIIGIHQVEANLLNPKIIGVAAKLHPVLIVFSLLVGEHYFGLWGALLAVPVLSTCQSVFNHFRFGLPDVEADSLRPPEISSRSRGLEA